MDYVGKAVGLVLMLAACQRCIAVGDTNIIAVGEWSAPISLVNDRAHEEAIRGRLLVVQGMEPAYGGPLTTNGAMTFVELQNVTGACCEGIGVYFAVTNLHCELSDGAGKLIPKPVGVPWGGRGPLAPCWVNLPYNSKVRLFVNGGRMDPLTLYPSGEPWCYWSIQKSGTNTYYLAGNLSVSARTNSVRREVNNATLIFPRTKIISGQLEQAQ